MDIYVVYFSAIMSNAAFTVCMTEIKSGISGSYSYILPFEELPDCVPKEPYHFKFPPAIYESSNFSESCQLKGPRLN
jgi:hypothetical protein